MMVIAVLAAASCRLSDVTIPQGDPIIVVHGVMRPDLDQQFVIVERTFTGTIDSDYDVGPVIPLESGPQVPEDGAVVYVSNLDQTEGPCGPAVRFSQDLSPALETAGVYWSPVGCPEMRPGNRLSLWVETAAGDSIHGETRVPGMDAAFLGLGDDTVPFGSDSLVVFNRDRDTLAIWVEPIAGRLLQVEPLRFGNLNSVLGDDVTGGAKVFADSTYMELPGNLIDVITRGEGEDLFLPGRHYLLSLALTDTAYYDFARSRSDPFTGRGFINRLTGGIGVFGSMVATTAHLKVIGDRDDPREGAYRMQGEIMGVPVDARLTLYLHRSTDRSELSGFLDGSWAMGGTGPGGIVIWVSMDADAEDADGEFTGNEFYVRTWVPYHRDDMALLQIAGTRVAGAPFQARVDEIRGTATIARGTLTVTQQ